MTERGKDFDEMSWWEGATYDLRPSSPYYDRGAWIGVVIVGLLFLLVGSVLVWVGYTISVSIREERAHTADCVSRGGQISLGYRSADMCVTSDGTVIKVYLD